MDTEAQPRNPNYTLLWSGTPTLRGQHSVDIFVNCEFPLPALRRYGRTLELRCKAGSSGTQQASCLGLSGPRVCSWDEVCPRQTQWRRAGKTSHPRLTWNQIRSQATCSESQWGKEAEQLLQSELPQKTPRHPEAPPLSFSQMLRAHSGSQAVHEHSRLPPFTCRTSRELETLNHRPHLWPWKPRSETARVWSNSGDRSDKTWPILQGSECILLQGTHRTRLGPSQDPFLGTCRGQACMWQLRETGVYLVLAHYRDLIDTA